MEEGIMNHTRISTILSLATLGMILSTACLWPSAAAVPESNAAITQTWAALSAFSQQETEEPSDVEDEPQSEEQPEATSTSTPGPPMISVSVDTNCRSGPGLIYEYLGALMTYEEAEVLAQSTVPGFWVIENPDLLGSECWVGEQYASIQGDTSGLPVRTPPPTATPEETAPSLGSIAGFIYYDGNNNGQFGDPQDSPIPNIGVSLLEGHCSAANVVFAHTNTDAGGGYIFTDVPPGQYCVVSGNINWVPLFYNIDMDGQNIVGINFRDLP
jgi:hypothetical protein